MNQPQRPTTRASAIRIIGITVAATLTAVVVILVVVTAGSRSSTPALVQNSGPAAAAPSTPAATGSLPPLSPAARSELNNANAAYRAGRTTEALADYRAAASEAPANAAPYFGIYMAASKLHNQPLADSALAEIRARSSSGGQALTDSALRQLHSAAGPPRAP